MRPTATLALLLVFPLTGCNSSPSGQQSPPRTAATAAVPAPPQYHSHSNRAHTAAAPGTFDLYLLNLSWSPEYCHSHANAAECAAHDTFVLHGLWPENADATYPSDCSAAPGPTDPGQYANLYPDAGLLQHEWQTHGTCSGLSPDAYFHAAGAAFHSVTIPPDFTGINHQLSLTPAKIQADFTASNPQIANQDLIITCGSNYLTAVEVCLDRSTLRPTSCPAALHTCAANTVRIPAPQ